MTRFNQSLPKEKCGSCSSVCSSTDLAIECDKCQIWYHIKCCDVSSKLYDFYEQNKMSKCGFQWLCSICRNHTNSAASNAPTVNINQRFEELETVLLKKIENLENKLVVEVSSQKKNIDELAVKPTFADMVKRRQESNG